MRQLRFFLVSLLVVGHCWARGSCPARYAQQLPVFSLTYPQTFQVVQRAVPASPANVVWITGRVASSAQCIEAQVSWNQYNFTGQKGVVLGQYALDNLYIDSRSGTFYGSIPLPTGGWYDLNLTAYYSGSGTASRVRPFTLQQFGVGDTFLIAGQSLAGDSGQSVPNPYSSPPQPAVEQSNAATGGFVSQVSASNENVAFETGPLAPGVRDAATVWKVLGTNHDAAGYAHLTLSGLAHGTNIFVPFAIKLAQAKHYPIGLITVAVGDIKLTQYLPGNTDLLTRGLPGGHLPYAGLMFDRFCSAMRNLDATNGGFRAIIWSHGERDNKPMPGDNVSATSPQAYRSGLHQLIGALDKDCALYGRIHPWFITEGGQEWDGNLNLVPNYAVTGMYAVINDLSNPASGPYNALTGYGFRQHVYWGPNQNAPPMLAFDTSGVNWNIANSPANEGMCPTSAINPHGARMVCEGAMPHLTTVGIEMMANAWAFGDATNGFTGFSNLYDQ